MVMNDDGQLTNGDSGKGRIIVNPGKTIYIQANTNVSDDPITISADVKTKEVGQMVAAENNLKWDIIAGNSEKLFSIDPDSGMIELVETPLVPQSDSVDSSRSMHSLIVSTQGNNGVSEQLVNIELVQELV